MKKIIVTVVGKDRIGIIASVCSYLSGSQINVLDISQTIVGGMFNMMVIADMQSSAKAFSVIADEMKELGLENGLTILVQKEEIFTEMHRI